MKSRDTFVSPLLLVLSVVFVSFLLMSNVLANQMVSLGQWVIDAGTLTFPVTYVLSDVFSEVYGYKASRRVTLYATIMNAVFALFIMASIYLPHPEWYDASHFQIALGSSPRIVVASILSYYFGDFVNDVIFHYMKCRRSSIRGFGVRAIVSSIFGSFADTTLFVVIAFLGSMPVEEMGPMILISVLLKTLYEVIILPVTYLVTNKVREQENLYAQRRNWL